MALVIEGANQNSNTFIDTVEHREDMAHKGIDFVLYEVIFSASDIVWVVSKSDNEISR